jgi:hypothetical protein
MAERDAILMRYLADEVMGLIGNDSGKMRKYLDFKDKRCKMLHKVVLSGDVTELLDILELAQTKQRQDLRRKLLERQNREVPMAGIFLLLSTFLHGWKYGDETGGMLDQNLQLVQRVIGLCQTAESSLYNSVAVLGKGLKGDSTVNGRLMEDKVAKAIEDGRLEFKENITVTG